MKEEACFMHVVKGNSRLYLPNAHIDVTASDNLLMKCGSYLNDWFVGEKEDLNEAILIHFYPDILRLIFEEKLPGFLNNKGVQNSSQAIRISSDQMIRNYMQSLLYAFEQREWLSDDWIKLKLKEILFILHNQSQSKGIQELLSDLFHENQHSFKEIVHSHLYDDLNSQDLAVIAGYSLSSFKRKFKRIFGCSPNQYIRSQRLCKAEELLTQSNQRISEIASNCGFKDLGYFSRSFSNFYELSPTAYRKLHAGNK